MYTDKEIPAFLETYLPASEERIPVPMNKNCEVCVVIPAYGERQYIWRPLESLAHQQGTTNDRYEVIIVVNNPAKDPGKDGFYQTALEENRFILDLVRYINLEEVDIRFREGEQERADGIRASGLKVFAVDKSGPGKTLPKGSANVGGARNRGLAEAVARFYRHTGKNGIVAHTDADTSVDCHYVSSLITAFRKNQNLVGLTGLCVDELLDERDIECINAYMNHLIELFYYELFDVLAAVENVREENTGYINFGGYNMASRAFEAAAAGGIPAITGHEDMEFGFRLARLGTIEYNDSVKVIAALRVSKRAERSKGSGMSKHSLRMKEQFSLKLKHPDQALYIKQLYIALKEMVNDGQVSAERLKEIVAIDRQSLLTEEELTSFSGKLRQLPDFVPGDFPQEVQLDLDKLLDKIDETIGRLDAGDAYSNITDLFCLNPRCKDTYLSDKEMLNRRIQQTEMVIDYLLNMIFAEKPAAIKADDLRGLVQSLISQAGIDHFEEYLGDEFLSGYYFRKLARILEQAENKGDAIAMVKFNFIGWDALMRPEPDSTAALFMEAFTLRKCVFDVVFGEHT
jgi:glycosyltransferase involved in cell wall biosynthesis